MKIFGINMILIIQYIFIVNLFHFLKCSNNLITIEYLLLNILIEYVM
jgi:hypothetical protein